MLEPEIPQPHPSACGKCVKSISERHKQIKCDICALYFHQKCSLKTIDFDSLIDSNIGWLCLPCRSEIFAFSTENYDDFTEFFFDNTPLLPMKSKCVFCKSKMKKNCPYNYCNYCSNYFHLKCSETSKKGLPSSPDMGMSKMLTRMHALLLH